MSLVIDALDPPALARRARVRISVMDTNEVSVHGAGESMRIQLFPDSDLTACDVFHVTLADMIRAAIGPGRGDDLLCALQPDSGEAMLLYIRQQSASEWCVEVLRVNNPEPDTSWTFTDAGADQSSSLREAHDALVEWLGPDALLFADAESVLAGHLVVKVDMQSSWLLGFPLSVFNQLSMGVFKRYLGVEWIVTDKTFVKHSAERDQIHRELEDLGLFLSNAVIILNTYHENDADVRCRLAAEALIEIFRLLRDIRLGDGVERLTLRWHLNPSAAEVRGILLNPSTTYFFADFEASTGSWESGEGKRLGWDCTTQEATVRESIAVDPDVDDLSHIRLMRVFHCNSIFDPYIDRAPANMDTIVSKLLRAGAWRVEGGMTKELYLDYLESLATLMLESETFAFVLRLQALNANVDLNGCTTRLWNALRSIGE